MLPPTDHPLLPGEIDRLVKDAVSSYLVGSYPPPQQVLGIPRGGMPVAYAVAWEFERRNPSLPTPIVGAAPPADTKDYLWTRNSLIVDDIVDTGQTIEPYKLAQLPTLSLIVRDAAKARPLFYGHNLGGLQGYVSFPWDERSGTPEAAIVRIIEFLGRDPDEPQLRETPRRFLDMMRELTELREKDISTTVFDHNGDDLVVVKDIPFYSLCEHHIMAYGGVAHIGYLPAPKPDASPGTTQILGLSKFARIVAQQAAGLTTQEGVTANTARAIAEGAQSPDVAVVTEATHSCMILRGAKAFGSSTKASSMLGQFRTESSLRAEFLELIR